MSQKLEISDRRFLRIRIFYPPPVCGNARSARDLAVFQDDFLKTCRHGCSRREPMKALKSHGRRRTDAEKNCEKNGFLQVVFNIIFFDIYYEINEKYFFVKLC